MTPADSPEGQTPEAPDLGVGAPELELAHILFMDIVGYSGLAAAAQVTVLEELQELVRALPEFREASPGEELLCLPTGDGMALCFFREPVAPLQCAIQIGRVLRQRPDLRLRMGIHSGPVYRVMDINQRANVSGGGINLAQQVMDCGDAGHILVSRATAELIGQMGAWPLEDLGECDLKHGKMHLYNIHSPEYGNAERPSRALRAGSTSSAPSQKVVLLCRNRAASDEALLAALVEGLQLHGYDVFWDRPLRSGMPSAEEVERRIREADAVIPLLSATSVNSERLAEQLQIARDAAAGSGKPRILTVCVGEAVRPLNIAAVEDAVACSVWESPEQTPALLTEVVQALGVFWQEGSSDIAASDAATPPAAAPCRC